MQRSNDTVFLCGVGGVEGGKAERGRGTGQHLLVMYYKRRGSEDYSILSMFWEKAGFVLLILSLFLS